jgi:hypothetical protein
MKTQKNSKKTYGVLLTITLFSYINASAQQNIALEDNAPTHSMIFIWSVLFFIAGFALLIFLKLREDAKDRKESNEMPSHSYKHRHHHPNHYGHRHQYHH